MVAMNKFTVSCVKSLLRALSQFQLAEAHKSEAFKC
jgi:hypothetical protein